MHEILSTLNSWFSQWGVWGLALNSCVESFFIIPPPDILLGAMCLKAPNFAIWYAFVCTLASAVGGVIGYGIGKFGGRPAFNFFFPKYKNQLDKVEEMYKKYGFWAVLFSAFTPLPYKVFTIASGILEMDFLKFFLASFIGRGMRFFFVSIIIMFFGAQIVKYIDIVILILTIGIIVFFWVLYKKGKKQ